MKVLITGGMGFIGSHISRLLLDAGHEVLIYDNLSKSDNEALDKRVLFLKGDLKDSELLKKSLVGVDAVIHMASFIEVAESVKDPLLYVENNVLGSVSLFEAMKEAGVKKIIFSSSACVYGTPEKLPITEESPMSSANPYGASKVAVENLLQSYNFNHNWDVTILRYFNPYGPGEAHQPETHAIPNFTKAALNKKPIPLYWKGECVRDFIYVEDLARAHTAVLDLNGYNVFNVGTESGVKIIEVIKVLEEILGYKLEVDDLGNRPGDVMANYASSKKLNEATGWKAKVGLKEGLEKTVEWFSSKN